MVLLTKPAPWAAGATLLLFFSNSCVESPVQVEGGEPAPKGTEPDDGAFIEDEPDEPTDPEKPPPKKTVDPVKVPSQIANFDASYPDVDFTYVPPNLPDACARAEFPAERLPVDVYVLLDRSGSMNIPESLPPTVGGDCDVGDPKVSRWCYTLNALDGFFSAETSAGMGVGLQFFPGGGCSETPPIGDNCCASGSCCGGGPDSVPVVPLGELPENHDSLVQALNNESPAGVTTPIEAALRGLTRFTAANKTPLRSIVGLLITDGAPTHCDSDTNALSKIVAQHLNATGIPTFVLGMNGAVFNPLEAIAKAGGAATHTDHCPSGVNPCHVYNVGNGNPAAFVDALEQIKGSVVQCRYKMPTADGGTLDPNKIRVVYTAGAGDFALQRVNDVADCSEPGFYYDDNENPTELSLCPQACGNLRAAAASEVRISVDCLGI